MYEWLELPDEHPGLEGDFVRALMLERWVDDIHLRSWLLIEINIIKINIELFMEELREVLLRHILAADRVLKAAVAASRKILHAWFLLAFLRLCFGLYLAKPRVLGVGISRVDAAEPSRGPPIASAAGDSFPLLI